MESTFWQALRPMKTDCRGRQHERGDTRCRSGHEVYDSWYEAAVRKAKADFSGCALVKQQHCRGSRLLKCVVPPVTYQARFSKHAGSALPHDRHKH